MGKRIIACKKKIKLCRGVVEKQHLRPSFLFSNNDAQSHMKCEYKKGLLPNDKQISRLATRKGQISRTLKGGSGVLTCIILIAHCKVCPTEAISYCVVSYNTRVVKIHLEPS